MSAQGDPLHYIRAKRERLEGLLRSAKSLNDAAPTIKRLLDITEWEERALLGSPSGASELPTAEVTTTLQREADFMLNRFPEGYVLSPSLTASASAYTSAGASAVFTYVESIAALETPAEIAYADAFEQEYRQLQASTEHAASVREQISSLANQRTVELFDKAAHAYASAAAGLQEPAVAALAMRTLLDAVKGDLWTAARSRPKANMTWARMTEQLGKGPATSPEREELLRQQSIRSKLYNDLSATAKERSGTAGVGNLWARTLDHVDAVLGLVELDDTAQLAFRADSAG